MCGFRPFFVLTAASAIVLMLAWLCLWQGWLRVDFPGGSLLWHSHELIFGFASAAIAGFVLTAIPEFTQTPPIARAALLRVTLIWIAARLAYALAGVWSDLWSLPGPGSESAWLGGAWLTWLGLLPAAALNLGLWALLLKQVAPAVWRDPQRKHVSFAWALAALALLQQGFFLALPLQTDALAWLRAAVGVMMMLIVIAASRVSMAVMNGLIEQGRPGEPETQDVGYLARPPRRNLVVFCIAVCSLVEFALGHNAITGWTALAAAAAMLNLLNDWHVGKPLFATRYAVMMYAFYWLVALGYALMGATWLGAPLTASAGQHVLMVGAMGLSIFTIMSMVGRIHAGLWLDRRPWIPCVAAGLALAALLRAGAGAGSAWTQGLIWGSGLLWIACFAAYLCMTWSVLTGVRSDGQEGCAEPLGRSGRHGGGEGC